LGSWGLEIGAREIFSYKGPPERALGHNLSRPISSPKLQQGLGFLRIFHWGTLKGVVGQKKERRTRLLKKIFSLWRNGVNSSCRREKKLPRGVYTPEGAPPKKDKEALLGKNQPPAGGREQYKQFSPRGGRIIILGRQRAGRTRLSDARPD